MLPYFVINHTPIVARKKLNDLKSYSANYSMNEQTIFTPHMPEVDPRLDIERVFERARKSAAALHPDEEGIYHKKAIIVTPGRLLVEKSAPLARDIPAEMLNRLIKLAPPEPPLAMAVITYTLLEALQRDMRKAIPFIDHLLGFSALGHSVWAFEGHPDALQAGCRSADLLLVDSAMLPFLDELTGWQGQALAVMRGREIKLISRL